MGCFKSKSLKRNLSEKAFQDVLENMPNAISQVARRWPRLESRYESLTSWNDMIYLLDNRRFGSTSLSLKVAFDLDESGPTLFELNKFLEHCSNLTSLSLIECQLSEFPYILPGTLETLNLSENFITSMPDSLINLTELKNLNLSGNKIPEIRPLFAENNALEVLNISGNSLKKIHQSEVSQLGKLKVLDASCNTITALNFSLSSLPELEKLNMSVNCLEKLLPEFFEVKYPRIQCFLLFSNPLQELSVSIQNFYTLRILDITDTKVYELPWSLINLKYLEVLSVNKKFMNFPSNDVINRGLKETIKYLKKHIPSYVLDKEDAEDPPEEVKKDNYVVYNSKKMEKENDSLDDIQINFENYKDFKSWNQIEAKQSEQNSALNFLLELMNTHDNFRKSYYAKCKEKLKKYPAIWEFLQGIIEEKEIDIELLLHCIYTTNGILKILLKDHIPTAKKMKIKSWLHKNLIDDFSQIPRLLTYIGFKEQANESGEKYYKLVFQDNDTSTLYPANVKQRVKPIYEQLEKFSRDISKARQWENMFVKKF